MTPSPQQREFAPISPQRKQREPSRSSRPPKAPPTPSTRPTRTRTAPKRYGYDGAQGFGYSLAPFDLNDAYETHPIILRSFLASITGSSTFDALPAAFKARAVKDPDTLSFEEAMRSPHKAKWMEAAQGEISSLEAKGTWTEVPMANARTKIIPGTWVFRVKRSPSGEIKKYKARYCVRGDLEEDNGDDNYAPVVAWSTVRLFLVLSFIWGWHTASIDFTNAFVQSILESPIWIHIPRGFVSPKGPGTCLELARSLYGLRRSPKLFSETALDAFKQLGFVQSSYDPCLLYKSGMMIVMYVDDCGIGAADP